MTQAIVAVGVIMLWHSVLSLAGFYFSFADENSDTMIKSTLVSFFVLVFESTLFVLALCGASAVSVGIVGGVGLVFVIVCVFFFINITKTLLRPLLIFLLYAALFVLALAQ